jgi:hypothetical protein
MFEAMRHMLDFGEFTFANALIGQAGRAELNERAFNASMQRHPKQLLEFRNGRVSWSWSADRADGEEAFRSRSDWCFRLPLIQNGVEWGWLNFCRSVNGEALLVDTNYLTDLFRREFTDAVARILTVYEECEPAPVAARSFVAQA